MINNTIIEANKQGRKATVFALAHPALYMIEMAAHVGFEAISIDGEHGGFPEEAIDDICRTANGYGMSVIARVPDNAAYQINLYLDRGIQGVTGPHINSGRWPMHVSFQSKANDRGVEAGAQNSTIRQF